MTEPTTRNVAPTVTEFGATLMDLDKGRVHDDATERMAELIQAVVDTGGKTGTLTLTCKVEALDPATFEDDPAVVVTGKVEIKKPTVSRAPSVFWAKTGGQLTRQDPGRRDPRDG